MMHQNFQAIILAAGKSSRFNTQLTKLAHPVCGQELITYPAQVFASLTIPTCFVVGHQHDLIMDILKKKTATQPTFVIQEEQQGTGHALACSRKHWQADSLIVMNGDLPLVTPELITQLIQHHTNKQASVSFVTTATVAPQAEAYGRIFQDDGKLKIIEARHLTGIDKHAHPANAGIYIFKRAFLEKALSHLAPNNESQEIYITDLIHYASQQQLPVTTIDVPFTCIQGVNTLEELHIAERNLRSLIIQSHMKQGVRFADMQTTYLDANVTIGADTYIGANVTLANSTNIGKNCSIENSTQISNSTVENNVTILPFCVIHHSHIKEQACIGPFAHLRGKVTISQKATVGNFVEMKSCSLGHKSKAKHLSYLGDATIGSEVNIGAGTIICNYNGVTKNHTFIEDKVHIGSNTALLAPLTIHQNAIIAAGSVINLEVPSGALAIARSYQTNKENYVPYLREKLRQPHSKNTASKKTTHPSLVSEEA